MKTGRLTLVQCYTPWTLLTSTSSPWLSFWSGSQSRHLRARGCHVSQVSSPHSLDLLQSCSAENPSWWVCLMFSHDQTVVIYFGQYEAIFYLKQRKTSNYLSNSIPTNRVQFLGFCTIDQFQSKGIHLLGQRGKFILLTFTVIFQVFCVLFFITMP